MINNYALTLVFKNDLGEKERKVLLDSVTKRFGKLEKEELWGARDLAYPIKHITKGFYAHYFFSSEPNTISPLDKAIKVEEDIIRYLLVRV